MNLHILDDDRRLNLLADIHRDLSRVESTYDLLHAFLRQARSLSGFEYVLSISTHGLEGGWFRVMNRIALPESGLTRNAVREHALWPNLAAAPIQRSPILSELIVGERPAVALECDFTTDPDFAEELGRFTSALVLPVFITGDASEWAVMLRRESVMPELPDVRTAMQACSLLSQAVKERRLREEVHRLNEDLTRQIAEIARVQKSILVERPPQVDGLSIAVAYEPCAAAGGDYYDFQKFDDARFGVVIGDVSGHGPAASVVMAMLRTAMSAFRISGHPYHSVVRDVNELLYEALDPGIFVTAFFLHIDIETGEVTYANCGHPAPVIRRASGRIEELNQGGTMPLGIVSDLDAAPGSAELLPGDTVLLYTDGIVEAFDNDRDRMFGDHRLHATISATGGDPDDLVESIDVALREHTGERPMDDDRCLVAVRFDGLDGCRAAASSIVEARR